MKKIIFSLFILSYSFMTISQNCFIPLNDQMGIRSSNDINTMETSVCEFKDSLPRELGQQFKMFDFGFYSLNDYMFNRVDRIWKSISDELNLNNTFFLLVGRASLRNKSNIYYKVELNIPLTGLLSCVSIEQVQLLRHQIEFEINQISNSTLTNIENHAISILNDFIQDKLICCENPSRISCGECIEEEEFIAYLKTNSFVETSVETMSTVPIERFSNNLNEYSQINFTYNSNEINVNNSVKNLVSELKEITNNVFAEIHTYSYENCSLAFQSIESNPFSQEDDLYFLVKVVANPSILGDKIYLQVETNLYQGEGEGAIYLKSFDNNLSATSIIKSANYFFNLAGLSVKLKEFNQKTKIGWTDAFAFVGKNRSNIKSFILNSKSVQPLLNLHTCEANEDIFDWLDNPGDETVNPNPERSPGNFILVATDSHLDETIDSYTNFNDKNKLKVTGGKLRMIGFLILHGTSHIAGFRHDIGNYFEGRGYASSGNWLQSGLKCDNCDNLDTFESIIEYTKEEYLYIINQTNGVFGY